MASRSSIVPWKKQSAFIFVLFSLFNFPCLVFAVPVTGTNGNDIIFFQGSSQAVSTTLTNPYSGASIPINGTFNVGTTTYDGLAGIDTIFMTNLSDLILPETGGVQTIASVERIIAGDESDVLNLASTSFTLGNLFIDSGRGNDIIWSNAGNDTLRGFDGNDLIDGGPGNDTLWGQNGNDILDGNSGSDSLNGGTGLDILRGGDGNDNLQFFPDFIRSDGKNGSFDIFNGGAGYDTILGTAGPDAILAWDNVSPFHPDGSPLRIIDVEEVNVGFGDDIIDFRSSTINFGDLVLKGEDGDDLIYASGGNDSLWGGRGRNSLFGGSGVDTAFFNDLSNWSFLDYSITSIGVNAFEIRLNSSNSHEVNFLYDIEFVSFSDQTIALSSSPIPEPSTMLLFGTGLLPLLYRGWKSKHPSLKMAPSPS